MVKSKVLWYVVGLIAVLVVISVAFRGNGEWQGTNNPTPTPSDVVSAPSTSVRQTAIPKPSVITTTSNYGDVVEQYGSQRIQFDMYCQARPANNTYINGSYLMLDNRSGDARIVTVNGVQYNIAGYGWKVIQISSKTLPATWAVDCGAARNVSKILIQK